MPYPVWVEIVCRDCSDTVAGTHSFKGVPRTEMTKEARKRKWELTDNEWYCPHCAKKRKENL